mmetsp:Transcript_31376/g.76547  ORF Transcript_31376/g.76547 Transcript_31376/m.76547 type:complete len:133 (+) Transcript_31376:1244-1642(+)
MAVWVVAKNKGAMRFYDRMGCKVAIPNGRAHFGGRVYCYAGLLYAETQVKSMPAVNCNREGMLTTAARRGESLGGVVGETDRDGNGTELQDDENTEEKGVLSMNPTAFTTTIMSMVLDRLSMPSTHREVIRK